MSNGLKVIIPVAGIGTRMRPHTYSIPKPLLPVAGKPVLAHVIDPLLPLEPEEVVFVIGHLGIQIVDFVQSNYSFKAVFVEQEHLLGLGYAIHLAVEKITDGPVMVVLGDTIARTDFPAFVRHGGNVVGLKEVADPRRFGVAVVADGHLISLEEKPKKPKSTLALMGLYYFEQLEPLKSQLARLVSLGQKTSGEIQLTDALQFMIQDGAILKPFLVDGWYDCGKLETFLETNRRLLDLTAPPTVYPGSVIIPPVSIAPSAVVEESIIGPYVSISDGARVRRSIVRDTIIAGDAVVETSLLESSIIGEKTAVRGKHGRLNIAGSTEFGI
ncbi:conserved hypothetical protein [Candidatus Zixiibacteriota bacterium]|nr:conserved hypothetical protein [candidate division Zixibacteria bacterium]